MTREELLKALTYIVSKCDNIINNKNYTADDFVQDTVEDIGEVCNMILDGKYGDILEHQPSLPSNLDEAVFAYEDSSEYPPANQEEERMVYDAFKKGAEWMARQGYTVDGIVFCDKELTGGYKDIVMSIPDDLKVDDEVTLQIRKRQ